MIYVPIKKLGLLLNLKLYEVFLIKFLFLAIPNANIQK
jgi:hypothetical protein